MKYSNTDNSLLFSAGTNFAKDIDDRYYGGVHYVWCSNHFNDSTQPITSRPYNICKRFLEQIITTDRHAFEIDSNIKGVLRGAHTKLRNGVITPKQHEEICQLTALADYSKFFPVLYVIDRNKIEDSRCKEVNMEDRASDKSVEYIISDLKDGEYDIIDFQLIFSDFVNIENRRAGE